jgi:hypothetical protein
VGEEWEVGVRLGWFVPATRSGRLGGHWITVGACLTCNQFKGVKLRLP